MRLQHHLSHARCLASLEGAEDHGAQSVQWDQPVTPGHPEICPRRRPVRSSLCQVDLSLVLFFGWGGVVKFGKFTKEETGWLQEKTSRFSSENISKPASFFGFTITKMVIFGPWGEIYQGQWFLRRVRAAKVERETWQCQPRSCWKQSQSSTSTDVAWLFFFFLYDVLVLMIIQFWLCINYIIFTYIYVWFVSFGKESVCLGL